MELKKKVPPGALAVLEKRRAKFVRIGRKHHFVRIGEKSDPANASAEPKQDAAIPDETELARIRRRVRFVRIGRKPAAFVRTGKTFAPNENYNAEISPDSFQRMGRRVKFVRIGRKSSE